MKLKRYPRAVLKKYIAEQLDFSFSIPRREHSTEPHQIIRCCKCNEAKKLDFHTTGGGELYYKCPCGFESEPLGPASTFRKGFDIP